MTMPRYVLLEVRPRLVHHGYDSSGRELTEEAEPSDFAPKLVALERLLSATEATLLVQGPFGRQYYWEYRGGLARLTERLASAGLVIGAESRP